MMAIRETILEIITREPMERNPNIFVRMNVVSARTNGPKR
jgi:hypothetical protein